MGPTKRRIRPVIVVNVSNYSVERAGYLFPAKKERHVGVTKSGYAEISACQSLQVFEPGFKCDSPGCDFVAVNERSLAFHKKTLHQQKRTRWRRHRQKEMEA